MLFCHVEQIETSPVISRIARNEKSGLRRLRRPGCSLDCARNDKIGQPRTRKMVGGKAVARTQIGVAVNRAAGATSPS
jgi:hypothetical protein